MLPIVWRATAIEKLSKIVRFIAEHNPTGASNIKSLIEQSVLPTAEHPYLFRPGRVKGTREIVAHPNYVVVYRVMMDRIEVLAVVHARQQYP
jgi:toxin ParE1/3/4